MNRSYFAKSVKKQDQEAFAKTINLFYERVKACQI
jgi:hypothetical protein